MDNDMLSSLLSDPEALQNAMTTVSGMLGGAEPSPAPTDDYAPPADMMQPPPPVIGAIGHSGQSAVRQEKRALLGALKPFVTYEVAGQFDHALRLVSMARMARAAMGQLGQLGRTDDGAPPDSNTPQAL